MESKYKVNRLETTDLIRPMVDKHWEDLRTAKAKGELVGWASGPSFIFPYAMGIKCHFMAGYASYCGGIGAAGELLRVAESIGDLADTCSYHRLHTGMVEAILKDIPINEQAKLPMPDVMICGRYCTEQAHYSEAFYRKLGIRIIPIEMPFVFRREDVPRIRKFVLQQVKDTVIPALEDICGKPFDYDKMSEIIHVLKQTAEIRNKCWEYLATKPAVWTLWDYAVSMAPVIYMMGDPAGIPYYEKLLKELQDRKEKGIPALAPDGEKYRIYRDGWIPWAFFGKFMRQFTPAGAVCLCGRYPWEMFPYPEKLDPNNPIESAVDWLYGDGYGMAYHMSPKGAIEKIGKLIKEYSIDGMAMLSSKSCRMWNLSNMDVIDELNKKYGVPGVIIEADMIDPDMVSDSQIDTRLQALFETIDSKKK
jgi:benzoyl-CoA reductase/2-hydroxyglutaryl-CoA dehydratase subunit BcrC/BadD/HgdB